MSHQKLTKWNLPPSINASSAINIKISQDDFKRLARGELLNVNNLFFDWLKVIRFTEHTKMTALPMCKVPTDRYLLVQVTDVLLSKKDGLKLNCVVEVAQDFEEKSDNHYKWLANNSEIDV